MKTTNHLQILAAVALSVPALVAAGANDLSGPTFTIENDAAAKDAARTRALARADERARAYAAMLGYSGAKVLAIAEGMTGSGPMPEMAKARGLAEMAADAAPVMPSDSALENASDAASFSSTSFWGKTMSADKNTSNGAPCLIWL